MAGATSEPILVVENLKKHFPIKSGVFRRRTGSVKAVDGVSFSINKGEVLGLVGESGCGKSTTGRLVLRLFEPDAGRILYRSGQTTAEGGEDALVDISRMPEKHLKPIRRQMQCIFQDPYSSLNPRMRIGEIVEETFLIHKLDLSREQRRERVRQLFEDVGLRPELIDRYPHQFSGGQRQRVGIARALALSPSLIIADEPVSALDVSVQGQVLNLLKSLKTRLHLTMLFIAHDLSVVEYMSDRIVVMYLGKIVEQSPAGMLYQQPLHPYTEALIAAIPIPDPTVSRKPILLKGGVPSPINPPSGCRFHPRCPYSRVNNHWDTCSKVEPELVDYGSGHYAACHFCGELALSGIKGARA